MGIGIRDPFDLISRIMLVTLALWSVAFCFAFAFICGLNFSINWQPVIVAGLGCQANLLLVTIAYAISDVILDLCLLFMPIPSV